jgi:peptide deformylase
MHINYLDKNNETRHINMDTCIGRMAQHEKILHGEPMMDNLQMFV